MIYVTEQNLTPLFCWKDSLTETVQMIYLFLWASCANDPLTILDWRLWRPNLFSTFVMNIFLGVLLTLQEAFEEKQFDPNILECKLGFWENNNSYFFQSQTLSVQKVRVSLYSLSKFIILEKNWVLKFVDLICGWQLNMNYLDLVHLPATYHSLSPNFPSHLVNFMSSSLWWSSSSSFQDVFLERELLVHQGCIRHEGQQDDRVDGPCGDGHTEGDHKSSCC